MQAGRRQARLRPEYGTLYPGVPAGEWRAIGELLDYVAAARLRVGRSSGELYTKSGGAYELGGHEFTNRVPLQPYP